MKAYAVAGLLLMTMSLPGWGMQRFFSLDLGGGYVLVSPDSVEFSILRGGKEFKERVLPVDDHGSVAAYINTSSDLYVIVDELNPRSRPEEFAPWEPNVSRVDYFIISKKTDELVGPFSKNDFEQHPDVASLGQLDWEIARNPGGLGETLSIYMTLVLMCVSNMIYHAFVYWWVSIPILMTLFLAGRYIVRRRMSKRIADADTPGSG